MPYEIQIIFIFIESNNFEIEIINKFISKAQKKKKFFWLIFLTRKTN